MKVTFFNGSSSASVVTAPQIIGVGAALPAGEEGQVLGYGPGGVPRALDAVGLPYDDTGLKQRVQTLESTVAGKADVGHGHAVSAITGLQGILDGKAAVGHQHDLAAVSGLQAALDGKASATHTHGIAGVTGLQGALDGKAATTHTHGIAGVTGLQAALDGKAAAGHAHDIASVAGLQAVIDALTARIVALENGAVVTPPDPQPQPNLSPYQPDMTTGRIAQITTSFGGRPNVIPFTYFADGQDEMAAMAMGA